VVSRKASLKAILVIILGLLLSCHHTESLTQPAAIDGTRSTYPFTGTIDTSLLIMQAPWLAQSLTLYRDGEPVIVEVVNRVLQQADLAMSKPLYSVINKTAIPPSGDKHDYISIGPYWWPNSDTPTGLPWVMRDGETNPSSKKGGTDKPELNAMLNDISSLAMAYTYTQDDDYAKKAVEFIRTWFIDPKTRMNPNLRFGQAVPGLSEGRPYGVIETRWLVRLIDDIALLNRSQALKDTDILTLKRWYHDYLLWLINDPIGIEACNAHNNHGTYCEAQVASYALFVGKEALATHYVKRLFETRMAQQIRDNGAQPDELARTRPLHYSVFNLEAYFIGARVADALDMDYWHFEAKNGASLQRAVEFLLPALTQEAYWQSHSFSKKMRVARLFYFFSYAKLKFSDNESDVNKYDKSIERLYAFAEQEDRNELAQCFLMMPKPDSYTIDILNKIDPARVKTKYRCYY
jgi:hypothetical protein